MTRGLGFVIHKKAWVCCVAVLSVLTFPIFSQQNTATILGTVTDPSGASVVAHITVKDELTGFTRSTSTAADGSFLIPLLPLSTQYLVTAEAPGFKSYTQSGITLQLNQSARIDVRMELGSVTDKVEITASAPLVDTYSAAGGDVVERTRIVDLPLNGRNPLQLASLLPGVTASSTLVALTAGDRAANTVNVNGSRDNETDYQLDGMRFQGSYNNKGLNYPNPDALEEFKLITSSYSAEYGFYAGSIFTAVTRSGTNRIHGSLFEFLRNDKLNARNFFATTVPILRQNQFGASAGFPVVKNRIFGFLSYQGLRIRQTPIASSFPLTAAEREGVFSRAITDALNGQPFPNNTIPQNRFNPVAGRLLSGYIPVAPITNGGLLVTTGSNPINNNQWVGKTDIMLTSKDVLNSTFFFDRTGFTSPFAMGPYPAYGVQFQDQIVPLWSITETHTFSPTLLNQFRGGWSGQEETRGCSVKLTPRELGINIDLDPETPSEPPQISVTGRFNMGGGRCLWVEGGKNWQIADSLTWIRGKHNFKFGFDGYHRQFHLITDTSDPGVFAFDGSVSGNAAADFLLGQTLTAARRSVIDIGMQSWENAFFFQDDFRISRRLTMNLGLRYELIGPFNEFRGPERTVVGISQTATFRLGSQSTVFPNAPPGLLFTGDKTPEFPSGLPSAMVREDRKQIQPRIGLAWDVFGNGKTSVRASYGLYSSAYFGDINAQTTQDQPFLLGQTLFRPPGGLSDPWAGFNNPFPHVVNLKDPAKQAFFNPAAAYGWIPNYALPRVESITFGAQRELIRNLSIEAGYDGKLSHHLEDTININQPIFVPGTNANGQPKSTEQNVDTRRPIAPGVIQKINMADSSGNAAYHSFQFTARYRGSRLNLLSAYTWSKSLDTGQSTSVQGIAHQINTNARLDRGPSDFGREHVFRLSGVYDIPTFSERSALRYLLRGWQLSGIVSLTAGAPFSVLTGRDNSLTAQSEGLGSDRANVLFRPNSLGSRPHGEEVAKYFDTSAFALNAIGQFGNVGRNTMIGPGQANMDAAVMKIFQITEKLRLQFRAEFFNAFNRVNFGLPGNIVSAGSFGRITSAGSPRVVQLGLKANW